MYDNGKDRGTFEFWANLCRDIWIYHSILDSGSAYGYHHDRPMPQEDDDPMKVHLVDGQLEYATISLSHFLDQILDATDPVAIALETLLYAAGNSCNNAVEWLQDHLEEALSLIEEDESGRPFLCEWYVEWPEQSKEVRDALFTIDNWLNGEPPVFGGGFYTYNSENSFDQDFAVSLFIDNGEFYGGQYAIVRTHNGCDARGGFADPVVARVVDVDYFYSWDANLYCPDCYSQWETGYGYTKDVEQMKFPTLDDVDQWAERLRLINEWRAGQGSFSSTPVWDFPIPENVALDVIVALAEGAEIEDAFPEALVNGVAPTDRFSEADASKTTLLCPHCRKFSVYVSNAVAYGF